tara:strand:+ start:60 stop:335 length:276 start_codon:yes stop_codon:yes gene_type:complete
MSLGKKDIVKNITSKAQISSKSGSQILTSLINLIITKSKNQPVKISNFGTFYIHETPKRLGRNPKTKEEFIIGARKKLAFNPSKKARDLLN